MTSTQTTTITRTNHYFGTLVALAAVLALMASLLVASAAEPAHASTTFIVNLSDDRPDANPGDGQCSVASFGTFCSLRAAIQEANAAPSADAITFNINSAADGIATIAPDTALPPITQTVTIDGYTQSGASPNTKTVGDDAVLKVELDGSKVPFGNGLEIAAADSGVIRGLAVNRFGTGIAIHGDSVANRVEGNFIGTDTSGTLDRGNAFDAVALFGGSSETVVGGDPPAARNVLSGNDDTGIFANSTSSNHIQDNYVGTDKNGTKKLGNQDGGVFIESSPDTTIGGTTAASRNVISGNGSDGLSVVLESRNVKVLGNRIGTTANGTGALGNGGFGVDMGAPLGTVGDGSSAGANIIAFNGRDGVLIEGQATTGNTISRDSIFSNSGIGINLVGGLEDAVGNTANDPGDADQGPNGLQNKPVLTSAKTSSTKTTVTGKLSSRPNSGFDVLFYSNPSGNEGKKFLGQKHVNTDASGNASFTFTPLSKVAAGQTVTVTATSTNLDDTFGNTSEFSAPRNVTT